MACHGNDFQYHMEARRKTRILERKREFDALNNGADKPVMTPANEDTYATQRRRSQSAYVFGRQKQYEEYQALKENGTEFYTGTCHMNARRFNEKPDSVGPTLWHKVDDSRALPERRTQPRKPHFKV